MDIFKKPSIEDRLPQFEDLTEENETNYEKLMWMRELCKKQDTFDSPIDINLSISEPLILGKLCWYNYDSIPKKVKFTNTGQTVILSAKFFEERPYITGGPFVEPYVFDQFHFHWGKDNREGSEHTVDGSKLPLEMHVVHFKTSYETLGTASKFYDGIAILVYLFQLQEEENPRIQVLVEHFRTICGPPSSFRLPSCPASFFFRPFFEDYYTYWGSVDAHAKKHTVLWIISREPIGISLEQLNEFRMLTDGDGNYMVKNFREVLQLGKRRFFHVNPGASLYGTLLQIPKDPLPDEASPRRRSSPHF